MIFLGFFFIFKNLLIFIPHGWQIWKSHKIHEDSLTSCTMGTLRSWPCCVQEQLSWELPSIYFTGNGTDILPKLQHIWPKKRMSRNVSCWIGTSEFHCSNSVLYFGLWKSAPHLLRTHKTFCSTPVVFQNLWQRKGGQIYCYFVTMLGESKENPYTLGKKKIKTTDLRQKVLFLNWLKIFWVRWVQCSNELLSSYSAGLQFRTFFQ